MTRDLVDLPPGDGVSTPWLVFEWHVVRALARDKALQADVTRRAQGILERAVP